MISGERNLLARAGPVAGHERGCKQLFELFEHKTSLMQILDVSLRGQGVQIFIGGESGFSAPDDVSVVTSPYKVDGEVVGTVGVIGPTRMAYDRVIPIVDITAKLPVHRALAALRKSGVRPRFFRALFCPGSTQVRQKTAGRKARRGDRLSE